MTRSGHKPTSQEVIKMKLTKLERLFLQTHIDRYGKCDGSNCISWDIAKGTAKLCNISEISLKGVFGSLEKKGIIYQDGTESELVFTNGRLSGIKETKIWYFNMPVCSDNYPIATIEFIESRLNSKQLSK
jgi:hypothetical protein